MNTRRILEVLAMLMIGDGILATLFPRRHVMLWKIGPPALREAMDEFAKNPGPTRAIGALQVALGIWLAFSQEPRE